MWPWPLSCFDDNSPLARSLVAMFQNKPEQWSHCFLAEKHFTPPPPPMQYSSIGYQLIIVVTCNNPSDLNLEVVNPRVMSSAHYLVFIMFYAIIKSKSQLNDLIMSHTKICRKQQCPSSDLYLWTTGYCLVLQVFLTIVQSY